MPQQTFSGPRKYSADAVNARPPLESVPASALAKSLAATVRRQVDQPYTSTPIKADTAGSPDALKTTKNQQGWINSLRNLQWPLRKPTADPAAGTTHQVRRALFPGVVPDTPPKQQGPLRKHTADPAAGTTRQVRRALFPGVVPDTPPNQPPAPVEPAQPTRGTWIAAEAELLPAPDFGLISSLSRSSRMSSGWAWQPSRPHRSQGHQRAPWKTPSQRRNNFCKNF